MQPNFRSSGHAARPRSSTPIGPRLRLTPPVDPAHSVAAHRSKAVRCFRTQDLHERGSALEFLNRRTAGSERLAL